MNKDILAKAKQAKSPGELSALAAENGRALDEEKAKEFFEELRHLRELSEDELDTISGGGYGGSRKKLQKEFIQWFTSGQHSDSEPLITDLPIVPGRGKGDEGN